MTKDEKGRIVVKVNDFDIAKKISLGTNKNTVKAKMSEPYACPQQLLEESTSLKHDWWSAGVILYQLCSRGELPFQAKTPAALHIKIGDKNIKAPEL